MKIFILFLALCAAGVLIYHDGFHAPFILDGRTFIQDNPSIRQLWPVSKVLAGSSRPVTKFSFAVNYAIHKTDVFGFHIVNLCIHILASLVLFGLVRRTLLSPGLKGTYGPSAVTIAFATALIWAVHPIQTQSVTYIFQRSESMMGLFYLFTIYALARGIGAERRRSMWYTAACVSCGLGMGCKPVMITAPLMALAYDRVFWAGSWAQVWQKRRWAHIGLMSTWMILAAIALSPHESRATVGWSIGMMKPLEYASRQPKVILTYLRLAFWPYGFVFDYGPPLLQSVWVKIFSTASVLGMVSLTVWALRRRPALGFLGLWFFLILAPTSSFFPIADFSVEHRIYLPLAAVVLAVVLAARSVSIRLIREPGFRRALQAGLLAVITAFLCMRTIQRNKVYRNRYTLWSDVVAKRPSNPRAHVNLADALMRRGQSEKALAHYRLALGSYKAGWRTIGLRAAQIHYNIALALAQQDALDGAIAEYGEAIKIKPDFIEARNNLALALADQKKFRDAADELSEAIELDPDNAQLYVNRGTIFESLGLQDKAMEDYRHAVAVDADCAEAHNNLGLMLANKGMIEKAIVHIEKAHALLPDDKEISENLEEIRRRGKAPQAGGG